ncbi:hypothetical protein AB0L82_33905 [Nocardia sp. NPDC052001]|uniref:hypothetical protein n=1 Tax=Nocardia sp. NPDC052001 TaxID=3154853 RepID=UPI003413977B
MIVIIGLVILLAAAVIGLAGVLANGGGTHALTDSFAVFGYHVTGSTGLLFLYGIVVGAIGFAGLIMLLAGSRRTHRRGADARRELSALRRQTPAPGTPPPLAPEAPARASFDKPRNVTVPASDDRNAPLGSDRPPQQSAGQT